MVGGGNCRGISCCWRCLGYHLSALGSKCTRLGNGQLDALGLAGAMEMGCCSVDLALVRVVVLGCCSIDLAWAGAAVLDLG